MAMHLINSIGSGEKGPPPARPDGRTCSPKAASLGSQEGCGEGSAGEDRTEGEWKGKGGQEGR